MAELWILHEIVLRAVPSCHALSFVLPHPGGHLTLSVGDPDTGTRVPLSSLTVPLGGPAGDLLVLRAGVPGAFLLLADDLAGDASVSGAPRRRPVLDADLQPASFPDEASTAAVLADRRAVDQAVGFLLDRGLPAPVAVRELARRSARTGTPVAQVSRELLAGSNPADDRPGPSPLPPVS